MWKTAAYVSSVVLARGTIVATWKYKRKARCTCDAALPGQGLVVTVEPFWELPQDVITQAQGQFAEVARYLGLALLCVEYVDPVCGDEPLPGGDEDKREEVDTTPSEDGVDGGVDGEEPHPSHHSTPRLPRKTRAASAASATKVPTPAQARAKRARSPRNAPRNTPRNTPRAVVSKNAASDAPTSTTTSRAQRAARRAKRRRL